MGWGRVAEMNEYIVLFEYSLVQAGTVLNSGTLAYGDVYVIHCYISDGIAINCKHTSDIVHRKLRIPMVLETDK